MAWDQFELARSWQNGYQEALVFDHLMGGLGLDDHYQFVSQSLSP